MSIATSLTKLQSDISDAYSAINTKGGTIPANKNTDNLPTAIASIPSGGGTVEPVVEKFVNFYDYDGTLLYSYTKEEAKALTSLPNLPSHEGLETDEWTYTLNEIKGKITNLFEADNIDFGTIAVGALYKLTSSYAATVKIHVDLTGSSRGDCKLQFVLASAGDSAVINWGDNTSDTVTVGSTLLVELTHTYTTMTDLTITIESNSQIQILDYSTPILGGTNDNVGIITGGHYITTRIHFIEMYGDIQFKHDSSVVRPFTFMQGLTKMIFASDMTTMEYTEIGNNTGLKALILPKTLTTIKNSCSFEGNSLDILIAPKLRNIQTGGTIPFGNHLRIIELNDLTSTTELYFLSNNEKIEYMVLPDGITTWGNGSASAAPTNKQGSFRSCPALKKIHLPQTMPINMMENNMFTGDFSLEEVNIPNGTTTLSGSTFSTCGGLTKIVFPSSMTQLGTGSDRNTFRLCYGLKLMDFRNCTRVVAFNSSTQIQNLRSDCDIVVPDSLYSSWIVATNWSTYASQIKKASDYTD